MIIFDLETNGLLEQTDKIHCMVAKDLETGRVHKFVGEEVKKLGLPLILNTDLLIGHNIQGFDLPVLSKIYSYTHPGKIFDTLLMSQLMFTNLKDDDFGRFKAGNFPAKFIGKHRLEAWGYRLGIYKGDFCHETDWKEFSPEMLEYCAQDVEVCHTLYERLAAQNYSQEAIDLEHLFASIIRRQEQRGFCFDRQAGERLYAELLGKRAESSAKLKALIPPWSVDLGEFIPKRDNRSLGYKKGVPVRKSKMVEFNPGSRDHIIHFLKTKYNWKPEVFTDKGNPKMDEEVLEDLKYPEIPPIMEYMLIDKRISQLAEGDEAWLKHEKNGRIHGQVITNGCVTGRCSHFHPNLGQIPSTGSPYGTECRSLFHAGDQFTLVGCDASGLELRCLGHYLARYDNGAYANTVVSGKKEDGTDIHTVNQKAAGLPTRDNAKTFIYGWLYGAGDAKLGSIVGGGAKEGKALKKQFLAAIPALAALSEDVKEVAAKRGWLKGLDGRRLHCRSQHSALNTLLQSAGAIVMKKALTILDRRLRVEGMVPGIHYEFVVNVHDEWQAEVTPEYADYFGQASAESITQAGHHFKFRCPLAGEWGKGRTWAETH